MIKQIEENSAVEELKRGAISLEEKSLLSNKVTKLTVKMAALINLGLKRTKPVVMIFAILLLAGCWSCDSNNNDFAGLVAINEEGRKIYVECRGTGSPTVVFVSGLLDRAETWSKTLDPSERALLPSIAENTRVCAYDRPGTIVETGEGDTDFETSRSDRVDQPITLEEPIADLRALLTAIGESGPYVLVGHSSGGAFTKYFASKYPEEVSGLVLIDYLPYELRNGLSDEQWEDWKTVSTPAESALMLYPDQERLNNQRSLEQELAAAPLKPLPLIVLSMDEPFPLSAFDVLGLSPEEAQMFSDAVFDAVLKARIDFVNQVPGAEHITKTNSGHYIHQEQPELVIGKVRKVMEAARSGCMSLTCE